jgi:DNA-binding beta-propeller fold protein YncE
MSRRRGSIAATLAGVVLLTTACAGGAAPDASPTATQPPAAEPAGSPALSAHPVGTVVAAGPLAQGVAVDPSTGIVAVGQVGGADLFDESGRHLATVALPSAPRHIALAAPGGPFLVPAEASAEVGFVDEPGGTVSALVPTGRMPHDVVDADGTVFVGNEHDSTMTVIRQGAPVATVPVDRQPGGLAAVGGDVAVVSVRARRLQLFDAASLRPVASVPVQGGPSHVAAFGAELYVVDTGGTHVRVFDTVPRLHLVGSVTVPRSPLGIAVDATRGRLWVTCTASNQLVELSLGGALPRVVGRWPTVRQPDTVAVDPRTGTVVVVGVAPGTLEIIDHAGG